MTTKGINMLSGKAPVLGINGLGRIGKLTLWHHIGQRSFSGIVVNIGRKVGMRLDDIALYIEKDSSYGPLQKYLFGYKAQRLITNLNEDKGTMLIDGIPVTILRETRNPKEIPWRNHAVKLVVDATGKYTDPTLMPDVKGGSARGHIEAGADKVIVSAPFKIKEKGRQIPDDAKTLVLGINDHEFDPKSHSVISGASCTTTCLAYMFKPLLDYFGVEKILSVSMATVHGSTGSQEVLDRLPGEGSKDLRKNRSIFNNIILTTTGAARTLGLVIPEMTRIGFIAQSVRVPVSTGSLIILVIALRDENENPVITRTLVNDIYRDAEKKDPRGFVRFTEEQNVSSDIIGMFGPATIIEGNETHTRTGIVNLDLKTFLASAGVQLPPDAPTAVKVPITQAVIYGWYDNELGSYTNMLGGLTTKIAQSVY
ncbi:MAG TPA: glyceraldehyde 3-phosphate dehydrogenase NAD-binding domain-containing protein [Dissulfurispiraceae bacterium]|nr:glyceraldehyde 3-phosphate dehydrogenase NAD-binding domain-containing protein [Dissulfurispiraceae bacterium]